MSIWHTLDIAPTADTAIIRRAYARQLKKHRPESDPQGYQQLREAFEQAKQYAAQTAAEGESETVVADVSQMLTARQLDEWLASAEAPEAGGPLSSYTFTLTPVFSQEEMSELAAELVNNEVHGLIQLREMFDRICLEGSLWQQQQFHQALAAALARQPALTSVLLQLIDDILGWGLEDYNGSHLITPELQHALDAQARNTERERIWQQFVNEKASSAFLERKAAKLLLSECPVMPLQARLIPELFTRMSQRVNRLCVHFPELAGRLNPAILTRLRSETMTLSWRGIFLLLYWLVMLHFLFPGTLFTSVSGVAGLLLLVFYLYGSDVIMIGLRRHLRLLQLFLALECLFSGLLLSALALGVSFLIFINTPGKGLGGLAGVFMLLIEMMVLFSAWPGNVPAIRRPGITLSTLICSPWRLMEKLGFSVIAYPLLALFSGFCFMLLHNLLQIPAHLFAHH